MPIMPIENLRDYIELTTDTLEEVTRKLNKCGEHKIAAEIREQIVYLQRIWNKLKGWKGTVPEITVGTNVQFGKSSLGQDDQAIGDTDDDKVTSFEPKLSIYITALKKLREEILKYTRSAENTLAMLKLIKSGDKQAIKKLRVLEKEYRTYDLDIGFDEQALKEECLLYPLRKFAGEKTLGAKKLATIVMDEGGLIDKQGHLKYHYSRRQKLDYHRAHKALSNRIQRWINEGKSIKKGHKT